MDDLELKATLTDAVSAVSRRIEERLEAMERRLDDVDTAGRRAGEGVEDGAKKGEEALGKEEQQTKRTKKSTDELGDSVEESGEKAKKSGAGWDVLAKKLKRSSRAFGGFRKLLMLFKVTAIITAIFALVGAVVALGVAAVGAVGGIGAMLPGLLALGPIALAAMLGIKAFSMASEEMKPHTTAFKEQFSGIGEAIRSGGLGAGVDYLTSKVGRFVDVTERGMGKVGGAMGRASMGLGDFLDDTYRLAQAEMMFQGVSDIIDILAPGVMDFGGGLLNGLLMALPAGKQLSGVITGIGDSFERWTRGQLESGRGAAYITNALNLLLRAGGVLADTIVGLYRIFRIAAQESRGLGLSIEEGAARFKEWTGSIAGQASIREYFRQAMPAIRETFLLLGAIVKMIGRLAASSDVAPLLAQLRTEFLPALEVLLGKLTEEGGLGPALISAATSLLTFLSVIDVSPLIILLGALAALLEALAWLAQNVPGAGFALSALLTTVLLLGPAFRIAGFAATTMGRFASMGKWFSTAAAGAGKLTLAQRVFHGILGVGMRLGSFLGTLAMRILPMLAWAFRAAWIAATGPIGLIVIAIIAVVAAVIWLWNNVSWFRTAVIAVWNAITVAASAAWSGIVWFVRGAIAVIVAIAMWLWHNIFEPMWNGIAAAAGIAWNIISFIVQTVVFIIVAIIVFLGWVLSGVWWLISTVAVWVWQNVILPVIMFVAGIAIAVWGAVAAFFGWLWGIIVAGATWAWNLIMFVAQVVAAFLMMLWTPVAAFFGWLWGLIVAGATWAWNLISAVAGVVAGVLMAIWSPVAGFFVGIWNTIRSAGEAVWNGIRNAASAVGNAVRGVWNGIVGAVRGAYNVLARAWNSIPSVSLMGFSFSLPKLPTLWHGGVIEFGTAIVGEHGPEPLIAGGRFAGMLGARGPELATGLPSGGYVVPNLDTLAAMPSLGNTLPSGVAGAVSRSVPGYADLLRPGAPVVPPPASPGDDRPERELVGAVRGLARAVNDRPPPISADGRDTEKLVLRALRRHDRERALAARYEY